MDVNKCSLLHYLYLVILIILSGSRAEFIGFYYAKDAKKIAALLGSERQNDEEFNRIKPGINIFSEQNDLFRSLSVPPTIFEIREAVFKAQIFKDYVIPAKPLDQKRKLYLFKSDFNKIYAPHPVSFFMNFGWLKDESSFKETRKIISDRSISFVNFNLITDDLTSLIGKANKQTKATFYISNIGSTILLADQQKGLFNQILAGLKEKIVDKKKRVYFSKILYQFFVLQDFINQLFELKEFSLITQFGVFSREDIVALRKVFMD